MPAEICFRTKVMSDTTNLAQVIDPVCAMTIDPAESVGREDYAGKTFYFCSQSCLEKFHADPRRYAGAAPPAPHGK
jgi:Cu+-exporting ATPase